MKMTIKWIVLLTLLSTLSAQLSAAPSGTAFTYQGKLTEGGNPAQGIYDLRFTIYDSATNGNVVAGPLTNSAVGISNGLFTVTLDFGSGVFAGEARWLEIGVRSSTNGFSLLSPRQELTPAPHALYASSAGTAGSASNLLSVLSPGQLSGTYSNAVNFSNPGNSYTGNGAGLTNLDANTLNGQPAGAFWQVGGNTIAAGNFVGALNNLPLEFKVNGARALRLEPTPGAPNVIGGANNNSIWPGVYGATIGGGESNTVNGLYGTIAGGRANLLAGPIENGTIGGGRFNTISEGTWDSVIAGGGLNFIGTNAFEATIGGGGANAVLAYYGTTAGGAMNTNSGNIATIGGGYMNTASGGGAVVAGGFQNVASGGDQPVISGGYQNQATAAYAAVSGGAHNQSTAYGATVPGGAENLASGVLSFAAGHQARAMHDGAFVWADPIEQNFSSTASNQFLIRASGGVGIGTNNPTSMLEVAGTIHSTSGGFKFPDGTTQTTATLAAGNAWLLTGNGGTTPGVNFVGTTDNNELELKVNNQRALRLEPTLGAPNVIGGDASDGVNPGTQGATIGGGQNNVAINTSHGGVIGGGRDNQLSDAVTSTIGGGEGNQINAAAESTIAGGEFNTINPLSGGTAWGTIGGGQSNRVEGYYGTVPGGHDNRARTNSFAAGTHAKANHTGAFVWADSQGVPFPSTANDQVSFRCLGGMRLDSGPGGGNQTAEWTPASGMWNYTSDRHAKENFQPVDTLAVLEKLARLPLSEWNYIGYHQRHIGPMAQDWHALFPLNESETTLNSADLDGVALAAIQGLNQKFEEQRAELRAKDSRIQSLEERLAALEHKLNQGK